MHNPLKLFPNSMNEITHLTEKMHAELSQFKIEESAKHDGLGGSPSEGVATMDFDWKLPTPNLDLPAAATVRGEREMLYPDDSITGS